MRKEIFIIHHSDIILRGLNVILRQYFNVDITLLSNCREISSFYPVSDTHMIILCAIQDEHELNILSRLKAKNQVNIIQLMPFNSEIEQIPGVDQALSLSSTHEEIREVIASLMKKTQGDGISPGNNGELTSREKDVLRQVALGLPNKEIAEKLFISIHTVISHRKHITEKLGIKSISGLTVYALLNKVIDAEHINPEDLI